MNTVPAVARTTEGEKPLAPSVFSSASFRAFFWNPRFRRPSASLIHVPALFWLTAALVPRSVAVLGVGDGVLYFALCQALDKLPPVGRCRGYGYWPGGGEGLQNAAPRAFFEHQAMLYEDTASLVADVSFTQATEDVLADPVGLLCIDLDALPAQCSVSVETLLHGVVDGGAIVFVGTSKSAERISDSHTFYGAAKGLPRVEFTYGRGLLIVAKGPSVPASIRGLVDNVEGATAEPEMSLIFSRIGRGLLAASRESELKLLHERTLRAREAAEVALEEMRAALAASQNAERDRAVELENLEAQVHELREHAEGLELARARAEAALDGVDKGQLEEIERSGRIASETSRQQDQTSQLRQNAQSAYAALGHVCEIADPLKSGVTGLPAEQQKAADDVLRGQRELERARKVHVHETAVLTQIAEEWRARAKVQKKEALALQAQNTGLRRDLESMLEKVRAQRRSRHLAQDEFKLRERQLRAELRSAKRDMEIWKREAVSLKGQVDQLLLSTSWRVTRPFRGVKEVFLRRSNRPE